MSARRIGSRSSGRIALLMAAGPSMRGRLSRAATSMAESDGRFSSEQPCVHSDQAADQLHGNVERRNRRSAGADQGDGFKTESGKRGESAKHTDKDELPSIETDWQ